MIKIIPTTHLMPKEEIIKIIEQEKPEIIGVELCETRLQLLVLNPPLVQPEVKDESLLGKISNAIKKKAEEQKLEYGSDMITASKYALENGLKLACLDKNIMEIKELMDKLPQNELMGFLQELTAFENQSLTKEVEVDKTLNELKTKYPIAFEFLVTIRDLTIANNILRVERDNPNQRFIIFLGKGHEQSINKLLEKRYSKSTTKPVMQKEEEDEHQTIY
jgi:pheromone shutdown protein TraB